MRYNARKCPLSPQTLPIPLASGECEELDCLAWHVVCVRIHPRTWLFMDIHSPGLVLLWSEHSFDVKHIFALLLLLRILTTRFRPCVFVHFVVCSARRPPEVRKLAVKTFYTTP